jgi:predicted glycosyltransferase
MEIVRGLTPDFQIYFINGGEVVEGFEAPIGIEVINLPPIKTDSEFRELQIPPGFQSVEQVLECRRDQLLNVLNEVHPDVLMVELFPFGRRRFSTELIPLLEQAKAAGTKVVCSLRDIVVTKQDRTRHEEKICRLMNQYFDLLLIHGDPQFLPLEVSFSRVSDLNCEVHYTGYVVQESGVGDQESGVGDQESRVGSQESGVGGRGLELKPEALGTPLILTSVGGGRFGHELLECVAQASALLEGVIPHHIQMFTGPFSPDEVVERLQAIATQRPNLSVERYTPNFLHYMGQADLSISMAGYNTTMNVLTTGVRSLLLPFTGNDDQEQTIRSQRLEELGIVTVIHAADLEPGRFAQKVIDCLQRQPAPVSFDMQGVEKTAQLVRSLVAKKAIAA